MLLCERNEEIFIYCAVVSERCASVGGRCDSVEGGDVPVTIGRHSTTEHAQRPIGFADVRPTQYPFLRLRKCLTSDGHPPGDAYKTSASECSDPRVSSLAGWDCISDGGLYEMEISNGKSLVELGCGLTEKMAGSRSKTVGSGPYYLTQHNPWSDAESVWQDYRKLEGVLQEVHAETMVTPARKPLKLNILCQQFR